MPERLLPLRYIHIEHFGSLLCAAHFQLTEPKFHKLGVATHTLTDAASAVMFPSARALKLNRVNYIHGHLKVKQK